MLSDTELMAERERLLEYIRKHGESVADWHLAEVQRRLDAVEKALAQREERE